MMTATEAFVLDCGYELCDKEQFHTYPAGWVWGGVDDLDPSADPRWLPSSYVYYDEKFKEIWRTSGPACDEEAYDLFTWLSTFPGFRPVYLAVRRPNEEKHKALPVKYDQATDSVNDLQPQAEGSLVGS